MKKAEIERKILSALKRARDRDSIGPRLFGQFEEDAKNGDPLAKEICVEVARILGREDWLNEIEMQLDSLIKE